MTRFGKTTFLQNLTKMTTVSSFYRQSDASGARSLLFYEKISYL